MPQAERVLDRSLSARPEPRYGISSLLLMAAIVPRPSSSLRSLEPPCRYRFAGPTSYYFPASRDSHGAPLGDVNPGDERDLDEPVGQWWVPADDGTAPALTQAVPEPEPEPEPVQPDGPQPAPPAIVP